TLEGVKERLVSVFPTAKSPSRQEEEKEDGGNSAEVVLSAKNITVRYGGKVVVDGVDLGMGRSEIVALLGRNGAGKSTLLKCLVKLVKPDAGTIRLYQQSTAQLSVAQICRQVAYLPQNPDDLLFAETVQKELVMTLANHGIAVEDMPIPFETLLNSLGIGEYAHAYPRDLSVGQRQRVALAALLITSPDIILLDEPTRGLDPATKQAFAHLLRDWRTQGKAILLVTHDVELVAQLADRVIVLDKGRVTQQGSALDVLADHPTFCPQIAQLFPNHGWLTVEQALICSRIGDIKS
ncbi:MAG TPA: ABC transporter ATP-binding protein, partial [Anaerolineae bacterium]|nr:ABC transporter ATP-binding protein [Anaerolineae bacterium]